MSAEYSDKLYQIIGAAMEVHKVLKSGLLELIYQEALAVELKEREIPFEREKLLETFYKGHRLNKFYRTDFVCYDDIIIELKAVEKVLSEHRAQLFNYLRLLKKPVGVIINFGEKSLYSEKYFYDEEQNRCFIINSAMKLDNKIIVSN